MDRQAPGRPRVVVAIVMSALPYRVRDALSRATKADTLLLRVDPEARAAYEARIASPQAGER